MNASGVLSSSSSKNASNLFLVASCFGSTANSLVWIRARSRNSLTFLSLVCREGLFRFNKIKLILFLRSLLFSTDQHLQLFLKNRKLSRLPPHVILRCVTSFLVIPVGAVHVPRLSLVGWTIVVFVIVVHSA